MSPPLKLRLRSYAKTGFAAGLDWTGIDSLVASWRGLKGQPLVVGYHRVVTDFKRSDSLSISPMLTSARTFEQHLDWIGRRYRFVSLDELAETLERGNTPRKPVAAVTFDDGYRDVYLNAFPILRRKGIPSAVFVVSDLVGTNRLLVHDELHLLFSAMFRKPDLSVKECWPDLVASLDLRERQSKHLNRQLADARDSFQATRALLETVDQAAINQFLVELRGQVPLPQDDFEEFRMLDWSMLADMVANGVTVGSHTRSHALLANESPDVLREEIEYSKRDLEQRLGISIRHFAFPDGQFDANAIQAVADAGYHTAYTICAHQDQAHPRLTISRRMLWENACMNGFGRFSPAILSCQANGIFDPADACQTQHWA